MSLTALVATGEHKIYISVAFYATPVRDLTASKKKEEEEETTTLIWLVVLKQFSLYILLSWKKKTPMCLRQSYPSITPTIVSAAISLSLFFNSQKFY